MDLLRAQIAVERGRQEQLRLDVKAADERAREMRYGKTKHVNC